MTTSKHVDTLSVIVAGQSSAAHDRLPIAVLKPDLRGRPPTSPRPAARCSPLSRRGRAIRESTAGVLVRIPGSRRCESSTGCPDRVSAGIGAQIQPFHARSDEVSRADGSPLQEIGASYEAYYGIESIG
jgi:hypothetical protein